MTEDRSVKLTPVPGSPILGNLSLDEQITWFDDSLQRWTFNPALRLLQTENPDVDFAVLTILNSIPEMLAKYQGFEKSYTDKASGLTAYLYRKGIEYIFPDRDHNVFTDKEMITDLMYGQLRSGIAHSTFTGGRILISRDYENLSSILFDGAFGRRGNGLPKTLPLFLSVNVPEWYKQTKERVDDYINDLRDFDDLAKDELRQNFSERLTRGN